MSGKVIKTDQHGTPSVYYGVVPGVGGVASTKFSVDGGETWIAQPPGLTWLSPVVGADTTEKVSNLLAEAEQHPRARNSESFSQRAYWASRHLLDEMEGDCDLDKIVHLALELGFYTERARNELKPSLGGKRKRKSKIPKADLPSIEGEIVTMINSGMSWTQASDDIARRYNASGRAVRTALNNNGFTPPNRKQKTKRNSRK